MGNREIYDKLVEMITEAVPGFHVRFKSQSTISKILGFLSKPFNPKYMTDYITTRYPNVYFPTPESIDEDWEKAQAWKILAHEWVHLNDRMKRGPVFTVSYLLPQMGCLGASLSLLAIWFSNWWLLALAGLLLLAPLPAPGRRNAEMRGYTMSMAVNFWRYGSIRPETIEFYKNQFTGSGYYFMWPFKGDMDKRFHRAIKDIESGAVMAWPHPEPFKAVHALIQAAGR